MPNLKDHCESSKKRTGKDYRELHQWMDDEQKHLGVDHRFVRHDTRWMRAVEEKFGKEGVKEFFNHIIEDYQDTLRKVEYRFKRETEETKIEELEKLSGEARRLKEERDESYRRMGYDGEDDYVAREILDPY